MGTYFASDIVYLLSFCILIQDFKPMLLRVNILHFLTFCPTELEVAGVIYKFHMYCFDLVTYNWCRQSACYAEHGKETPNNNKYSERDSMVDRETCVLVVRNHCPKSRL